MTGEFRQRMIAAAFGSFDPPNAMKILDRQWKDKKDEDEFEVEEYVPQNEADVNQMLGQVRRMGIVE